MIRLDETQCLETISNHEMPAGVVWSNSKVAVIFTQSWCVDWVVMQSYTRKIDIADVSMYYVEYDKEPFYEKMKTYKEVVFKNSNVPYVRCYRDG